MHARGDVASTQRPLRSIDGVEGGSENSRTKAWKFRLNTNVCAGYSRGTRILGNG